MYLSAAPRPPALPSVGPAAQAVRGQCLWSKAVQAIPRPPAALPTQPILHLAPALRQAAAGIVFITAPAQQYR